MMLEDVGFNLLGLNLGLFLTMLDDKALTIMLRQSLDYGRT